MYYERCEMCGNWWQRIPLTMAARNPERKLNNRTVRASTGKRPVEIERSFCPHGHGSMMMQATPQQSHYWECSTCSTTSGLSLDGCDVSTCRPGELRVCRREHGSHMGRRDTVPLNVGQLKDVDQEAYLQLIYESGQRPENQITTLGLVPRQKVESGEQVTESFNIPELFFNCKVLDFQPTKSVPRQVRLAIERNIDEMCPERNYQMTKSTRFQSGDHYRLHASGCDQRKTQ